MGTYYASLWHEALRSTLAVGSSTGFSMLVLSIGAVFISAVLTAFVEWYRAGRTMNSFRAVWKQWPTYVIPTLTITALWVGTLCWQFIRTPVQFNQALIQQRDSAIEERNTWKSKFERRPTGGVLTTINPISFRQFPIKPGIGLAPTTEQEKTKPGVEVVITAQTEILNPVFDVECDRPCDYAYALAVDDATKMNIPERPSPNVIRVEFVIPALLAKGRQLTVDYRSRDEQPVKVKYVHLRGNKS